MRKKQKDYAENEDFFYYPFHRNAVPSLENVDVYFFFFFFLVRTILRIDPGQLERAVRLIIRRR